MKILNFGSCHIDFVYSLDHIVAPGETETTYSMDVFPGGKGLNQSIAISRAGSKIYHAGCIGNDGEILTEVLERSGVDLSYIKKVDAKNGHAIIQVNSQGGNSIFLYPGSNEMLTKDFIDQVLGDFKKGDIILLQNEVNLLNYIVKKAHKIGMQIVLNPSPFNEKILDIDPSMLAYLILNEVEAAQITGFDDAEESLSYFEEKYPDLKIILTLGGRGCVYMDKNERIYQPTFDVEVVDTTAAGDTFTGFFISGVAEGTDIKTAVKFASAAASISVSRNGASPSIPYKNEVLEALKTLTIKREDKYKRINDKIDKYISENLKNASVEELAKNMGYSTVYMGNLIKKITGKQFKKILHDKRCEAAAQMLLSTDKPIGEIIESVGYANESFFRKIFKEKFGKEPSKYRKSI